MRKISIEEEVYNFIFDVMVEGGYNTMAEAVSDLCGFKVKRRTHKKYYKNECPDGLRHYQEMLKDPKEVKKRIEAIAEKLAIEVYTHK